MYYIQLGRAALAAQIDNECFCYIVIHLNAPTGGIFPINSARVQYAYKVITHLSRASATFIRTDYLIPHQLVLLTKLYSVPLVRVYYTILKNAIQRILR